jgi:hypothetical protein
MTISSTFSIGKGSRKEGRQLTRFLSCSNPSETSLLRSLREHLLYVHSPVDGCASFFFPSISDLLGAISGSAHHESIDRLYMDEFDERRERKMIKFS